MNVVIRVLVAALCVSCWVTGFGAAFPAAEESRGFEDPPDVSEHLTEDELDAVLEFRERYAAQLEADSVTGLSLAVVSSDDILWTDSFGYEDAETSRYAHVDTPYLIGSVTKVFTAVAVMQLVDRGLVDLDESYTTYVPNFRMKTRFGDVSQITVRQLLTHHAGLSDDVWAGKFQERRPALATIMSVANDMHTCYPPGMMRVYSNLGYALLGVLVEQVSGERYEEYVQSRVFAPLGMRRSWFFTAVDQAARVAAPYDQDGTRGQELPLRDGPAGSIVSTASDMAKLIQAFLNGGQPILSSAAVDEMFHIQNMDVALDLDDRVGLCFSLSNKAERVGRTYEHGGATLNHRAQIYIAPAAGLGAVILSNSSSGALSAWMVHEQLLVSLADARRFIASRPDNPMKRVHFDVRSGTDLAPLTGFYAAPGVLFDVTMRRDMLHTSIAGNRFYLVLDSIDAFIPAKRFLFLTIPYRRRWFLFQDVAGHDLFIEATPWGDLVVVGERVERPPIHRGFSTAYGRYVPTVVDGELPMVEHIEIGEEDGVAVARFAILGGQDVVLGLRTISAHAAVSLGLGRLGGETVSVNTEGARAELWFKGMRFVRPR